MSLQRVAKSSTLYLVGNLAHRMIGFMMIPVYTHYLSTADYGFLEVVELLLSISVLTIGVNALGSAMVRIYYDQQDARWRHGTVSVALFGATLLAGLLAVVGCLLSASLSRWLFSDDRYASLIQASFLAMFLSQPMEIGRIYLRVRDRPLHFVGFSLSYLLIQLGLNIYFIVFRGLGIWGFVLSKILGATAGCLYMSRVVLRETGLRWHSEALRRMARFGAPLVVTGVATFTLHFADRFVLTRFSTLSEIGVYALAYKFGLLVSYLVGWPFGSTWNVQAYGLVGNRDWQKTFADAFLVLVFLSLWCCTGISVLARPAIALVAAPSYQAAALLVPPIALGYVARTVGDFFNTTIFINKRSLLVTRVVMVGAVTNVALNLLLVPVIGVWGAAWTTLISWCVCAVGSFRAGQREHALPLPSRSLVILFLVALLSYGASTVLPRWGGGWVFGTALALGYPLLAVALGCFSRGQIQAVRSLVRGLRVRLPAPRS